MWAKTTTATLQKTIVVLRYDVGTITMAKAIWERSLRMAKKGEKLPDDDFMPLMTIVMKRLGQMMSW